MKAVNIKWDIDLEEHETYEEALKEMGLPTEIEISEEVDKEDVSDWLSDTYGFCHEGFELE